MAKLCIDSLFLDFDGATDRLPIEMLFGLTFAWMITKLARRIYQNRMETSARINLIRDRNYKIRHAVEAIIPVPFPSNQQSIRVIREEVDRIEGALTEIASLVGHDHLQVSFLVTLYMRTISLRPESGPAQKKWQICGRPSQSVRSAT